MLLIMLHLIRALESARSSLPVYHAWVRTCVSELAVIPESVVRHVGADFQSVISSMMSVLSKNSKRFVRTHACVRTVSSPKVVYPVTCFTLCNVRSSS